MIRNPTDFKIIKKLKIKEVPSIRKIKYFLTIDGEYIGDARYNRKCKCIEFIFILPEFQRKGIATHLYNHIEKKLKIKLTPHQILLPKGKKFWKARLKKS